MSSENSDPHYENITFGFLSWLKEIHFPGTGGAFHVSFVYNDTMTPNVEVTGAKAGKDEVIIQQQVTAQFPQEGTPFVIVSADWVVNIKHPKPGITITATVTPPTKEADLEVVTWFGSMPNTLRQFQVIDPVTGLPTGPFFTIPGNFLYTDANLGQFQHTELDGMGNTLWTVTYQTRGTADITGQVTVVGTGSPSGSAQQEFIDGKVKDQSGPIVFGTFQDFTLSGYDANIVAGPTTPFNPPPLGFETGLGGVVFFPANNIKLVMDCSINMSFFDGQLMLGTFPLPGDSTQARNIWPQERHSKPPLLQQSRALGPKNQLKGKKTLKQVLKDAVVTHKNPPSQFAQNPRDFNDEGLKISAAGKYIYTLDKTWNKRDGQTKTDPGVLLDGSTYDDWTAVYVEIFGALTPHPYTEWEFDVSDFSA